jgi:hypothetical protein
MSIVPIMLPCDGSKTKVYMVSDRANDSCLMRCMLKSFLEGKVLVNYKVILCTYQVWIQRSRV